MRILRKYSRVSGGHAVRHSFCVQLDGILLHNKIKLWMIGCLEDWMVRWVVNCKMFGELDNWMKV
jgi:hypothetical protein